MVKTTTKHYLGRFFLAKETSKNHQVVSTTNSWGRWWCVWIHAGVRSVSGKRWWFGKGRGFVTLNSDLDKKNIRSQLRVAQMLGSCMSQYHWGWIKHLNSNQRPVSEVLSGLLWMLPFGRSIGNSANAVSHKKKLEVKGILPLQTLKQFRFRHFLNKKLASNMYAFQKPSILRSGSNRHNHEYLFNV